MLILILKAARNKKEINVEIIWNILKLIEWWKEGQLRCRSIARKRLLYMPASIRSEVGQDPCENKVGMNKQVIWNGDLGLLARRTLFFLPCSMCCTAFTSSKRTNMQYSFMSSCPTHVPSWSCSPILAVIYYLFLTWVLDIYRRPSVAIWYKNNNQRWNI